MRFAHISDLHLCRDPAATSGVRDDIEEMAEAIAHDLCRISDVLEFVVLSGDLTDDAHPDSFATVARIFEALPCPMFLIPGNHDGPAAYHAGRQSAGFLADGDISGRVIDLGTLRLLGLDTCIEAETTGALSADGLALLERELKVADAAPLVIVMHHAPFATGLADFDAISRLDGSAAFARLLRETGTRPIVLCGHIHRPYFATWHGAACFVAGSPAAPFTADLPFGDAPIFPAETQYSYFVHSLDAAGQHVITLQTPSYGLPPGKPADRP